MLPKTTRLRFVIAKDPETIQAFCDSLWGRIQIYQVVFANNEWVLWFVPDDRSRTDVRSGRLKKGLKNVNS